MLKQKIMPLVFALLLAGGMTGCAGTYVVPETASTSAAVISGQTTTSLQTTTTAAGTTDLSTDVQTEMQTTTATSPAPADPTAGMHLMEAYYYRVQNWNGPVSITTSGVVNGIETSNEVTLEDESFVARYHTNGQYVYSVTSEGNGVYYIDDTTATWSVCSESFDFKVQYDVNNLGEFSGEGTEEINGAVYRYEDYALHLTNVNPAIGSNPIYQDGMLQRSYFDDNGEPVGSRLLDETYANLYFTIHVEYLTDSSAITYGIPAGYTQVEESDMLLQLSANMLNAALT